MSSLRVGSEDRENKNEQPSMNRTPRNLSGSAYC